MKEKQTLSSSNKMLLYLLGIGIGENLILRARERAKRATELCFFAISPIW